MGSIVSHVARQLCGDVWTYRHGTGANSSPEIGRLHREGSSTNAKTQKGYRVTPKMGNCDFLGVSILAVPRT